MHTAPDGYLTVTSRSTPIAQTALKAHVIGVTKEHQLLRAPFTMLKQNTRDKWSSDSRSELWITLVSMLQPRPEQNSQEINKIMNQ
ncbi:hypothetical protein Y032_0002g868 [Ancylostoma ceylanicum]|uniref:Uncharacterized protein n=1 Tax=Ancylostoma ceylanicum TaxID=53326 RepID=A0A016W2T7_9BILA|nr:hypothetical protein Y032_0002g868 [Ancylostoma ceylanicum]